LAAFLLWILVFIVCWPLTPLRDPVAPAANYRPTHERIPPVGRIFAQTGPGEGRPCPYRCGWRFSVL